jgi:pimeloyl-ACP methyl ester carboxylesterase
MAVVAVMVMPLLSACAGSAPLTGHWTEVNGHKYYYERGGSGRPLILLHGGGETVESSYSLQLAALTKGHDVIAPEQVGQGHTPDVPGPLTYTGMMEDTVALMKQLDISNADVVGWSDGGNIALMLAVKHPELVRRIVASGANYAPDGITADELADTQRELDKAQTDDPDSFNTKLLKMWMVSPTKDELSIETLKKVGKPVLILVGDHDVIRHRHTLELFHALPKGQLCVLPDTGHSTFNARPEWVNPILLTFLDSSDVVDPRGAN